jgi:uridylate kinase
MNAALLIAALGDVAPREIASSYQDAARLGTLAKIVVPGGMSPGQTTDAVATLMAEYVHAHRLIIPTSVDGIYTADPEVDKTARKLDRITPQELVLMAMQTEMKAGSRSPIDPLAAKIIQRSCIPTAVVDGWDVENLKKGITGAHLGTEISLE